MIVGIPKEVKDDEYRVAITPAGVRELTSAGHTVYVEKGAGEGSSIARRGVRSDRRPDRRPSPTTSGPRPSSCRGEGAGARGVPAPRVRRDQVLFTYLHLAASRACTDALLAAGNMAIAYETVRLPDSSLPLLAPMSEVAGRMAPIVGAHHLMRPAGGRGVLVCGVPGVRCGQGGHPRRRRVGHGGRHAGGGHALPTSTSSTATSSGCARSTTISAGALRPWPRPPTPSRRSASTPTS